jgi:hypothetical protein
MRDADERRGRRMSDADGTARASRRRVRVTLAAMAFAFACVPCARGAEPPPPADPAAAYAECIARWSGWSSAGGIWVGDLTAAGARRGDPHFRRIAMHLKFTATGVRVSIRRPGHPWRLVGADTTGGAPTARRKDQVFIVLPDDRPGNRLGHAIKLTRLNDVLTQASYTRTVLRPRPGEAVEPEPVMNGILARAGVPVPAAMSDLGPQCLRPPAAANDRRP